mmetsp:Transcript_7343/g.18407  ORF Transcript_7343/g.18407 Transcript_7343/m.18407 type:complete len:261 (+) Transcript_7343:494-1276(+)
MQTISVHRIMIEWGLQGLEMSAACSMEWSSRSFFSKASCFELGFRGVATSSASSCCSSTKPSIFLTCSACRAMSVPNTMSIKPLRTYCCRSWACPSSADSCFPGNKENQFVAGSACIASKVVAQCMFSRMLLSLYVTASGAIVLVKNKLFLPGCPTSCTAAATVDIKWSKVLICVRMYSDLRNHSIVATTSAACAPLWYTISGRYSSSILPKNRSKQPWNFPAGTASSIPWLAKALTRLLLCNRCAPRYCKGFLLIAAKS